MRLIFLLFMTYTFLGAGGILEIDWSKVNKSQQKPSMPYPRVLVEVGRGNQRGTTACLFVLCLCLR